MFLQLHPNNFGLFSLLQLPQCLENYPWMYVLNTYVLKQMGEINLQTAL